MLTKVPARAEIDALLLVGKPDCRPVLSSPEVVTVSLPPTEFFCAVPSLPLLLCLVVTRGRSHTFEEFPAVFLLGIL